MTTLVSLFGILGRFAGDLLMSALGWASSLLFGRVPRSHQVFLVAMMAGSFAWIVAVLAVLLPSIASFLLSATPHPPFVNLRWLAAALLGAVVALPMLVGTAAFLVPAEGERVTGTKALLEVLRGYLLTPLIGGLLIFLAGVGITRKVRSARHGWVETHVPIVAVAHRYDAMVVDLQLALGRAGMLVDAHDAPRILTLPAILLTRVAGPNVRKLRAERLVELSGTDVRVGIYPYDIAISSTKADRTRLRASVIDALGNADAHLTTSSEAQAIETRIQRLGESAAHGLSGSEVERGLAAIDRQLLELPVSADEWDVLYRQRLKMECAYLRGTTRGWPSLRPEAASERIPAGVPVA